MFLNLYKKVDKLQTYAGIVSLHSPGAKSRAAFPEDALAVTRASTHSHRASPAVALVCHGTARTRFYLATAINTFPMCAQFLTLLLDPSKSEKELSALNVKGTKQWTGWNKSREN